MSTIAIVLEDIRVPAQVLMRLQKATELALGHLKEKIKRGQPVVECEIFDAQYSEHALLIRNVVSILRELPSRIGIYELPEGQTLETCSFSERYRIDEDVLQNILQQADLELDRQRDDVD